MNIQEMMTYKTYGNGETDKLEKQIRSQATDY